MDTSQKVSEGDKNARLIRFVRVVLLTVFILATSLRMYSFWMKGIYHLPQRWPANVLAGHSAPPDQYRVLYPLLWKAATAVLDGALADRAMLFATIVFGMTCLFLLLLRESRNAVLAGLALLAFAATIHNTVHNPYRDTFLDLGLIALAAGLVFFRTQTKGVWTGLVALTLLGAMNRESWAFVLTGLAAHAIAESGGVRPLLLKPGHRTALCGLAAAGVVYVATQVALRQVFGWAVHTRHLWQWRENLVHFLPWRDHAIGIGHGLWSAGSGILLLFLASVAMGNRSHLAFIAGYFIPLLIVSFFIGRWMETRIFYSGFALMICSMVGFVRDRIET